VLGAPGLQNTSSAMHLPNPDTVADTAGAAAYRR